MTDDADYKALEQFVVDNPDLEELEGHLEQFNIFEALGAVRQEVRHSNLLGFLLDPAQNHGLHDTFLQRFLKKALSDLHDSNLAITPIDLDAWDLNEAVVLREWQNIDVFIIEEDLKLAVVIENKIDSGESSGQLQRYRDAVQKQYPGFKQVFFYLTPDGALPSDEHYIPISYELILDVLAKIAITKESTLGPDILSLIRNYTQMLRRHIVPESEIGQLCQKIYHKHRAALDLIFEYRPDTQTAIQTHVESLIANEPTLIKDHCSKSYMRFLAKDWDSPPFDRGKGWTRTGRILLFEIENTSICTKLKLVIGPGDQRIRETIYDMAKENKKLFKPGNTLYPKYTTIFSRRLVPQKDLEEGDFETIANRIRKQWE
ncbi:PD-(D/E)XK nuclease family protein, partial [Candidatus Pacearchaeota archaeon]|nr:PD-(D/E)XK nuclease family protein [Candidatus Pacearchaeota archaeon]